MKAFLSKLTYSNVISTVCLFLLVGGGTAFAATHLGKNSVGNKQLRNGSVTSDKIENGTVRTQDLRKRSVTSDKLAVGAVGVHQLSEAAKQALQGQGGPKGERGEKGDRGERGPEGKGGSDVVTRYGSYVELPFGAGIGSNATCETGETAVGGGFDFGGSSPTSADYRLIADRPSRTVSFEGEFKYPPPANGEAATGWFVYMENDTGSSFEFRSYVLCASP